uniref:Rho termination factor-like N-terminal domain-containing protein n=1 Tax=viral metagenome TaxID=1070528 RepID=A0A6C0EMA6_9ZZZZ
MRLFLISLGVTCLVCVILFLYFRNRIGKMEQKVDLMFQLIQEYEQNKIIRQHDSQNDTLSFQDTQMDSTQYQEDSDLINVSDDSDSDSDSDEVSDDEDELLNIKETVVENIKSITLSGAEIESLKMGDDLDDISDLEETNMDDMIALEEVNNDEIEVDEQEENTGDNEEEIEEITVKKLEVPDNKPLDEKTIKELKQLAEEKGFTNYKGLRKNKLVELLAASQ